MRNRSKKKNQRTAKRSLPPTLPLNARPRTPPWPEEPSLEGRFPYYGVLGEMVRVIMPHSEAHPMAVMVQLLVGAASIIGRSPYYLVEATEHHVNLFAAVVGASSRARKGTALEWAIRILREVDDAWVTNCVSSGSSSGEGLVWRLRDPTQEKVDGEVVTVDAGVEDKRLLVKEPELGSVLRVLQRGGNTLSPILRTLWDTGCAETMTKTSPTKATNAHVCAIAHITKGELLRYFRREATNGFGNRFLWLAVKKSKSLPFGGGYPAAELRPLVARLRDAVAFARTVGKMKMSERAATLWDSAYRRLGKEHLDNSDVVEALNARNQPQVLRMACILALLDKRKTIRRQHLEAALAIWAYVEASISYIFGGA